MDEARLRELIEEATTDCYDEYEEFWGMYNTLADELPFPFPAAVLGDPVEVTGLAQQSSERRGVLVELRKAGQRYTFPLSELEAGALTGDAAEWVAAYQLWSR